MQTINEQIKSGMVREIEMVDLKNQYKIIKPEIDSAIQEVIDSSAFINGSKVQEFASNLADYLRVKHVIPCANGTDALQISLMTLELEPGDEVIVPVHNYVATAEAIALLKLKPVFVDVNPDDFTLDILQLEKSITSKTKAIVPVHLYGQCADMQSILEFAKKHSLYVIEDAAQALGGEYIFENGQKMKAGTIGHFGTTSFFPTKSLGCFGDGGAIFTNDDLLAEKCKLIPIHGQKVKYHHDVVGCNSRLDTIQAAILNVKLKYLDEYIYNRQKVADVYDEKLSNLKGIDIPIRSKNSTHVFHQYTIKIDVNRDFVKQRLSEMGIPSMIYYPTPLHLQKAYEQEGLVEGSFLVSENLSKNVLSLPIHTEMTPEDQSYIIENLKRILTEVNG